MRPVLPLPIGQTITVGQSNAMFSANTRSTPIQDAIDSVTDASANKQYTIQIFPGIYEENLVAKDYVSLVGVGGIRHDITIRSSGGTALTAAANLTQIANLTLESIVTAGGAKVIDATAGGIMSITESVVRMSSSTNGITGTLIDADCDQLFIFRSDLNYAMLGSAVGANTHKPLILEGTTEILKEAVDYRVTVADVDDDFEMYSDNADALCLIANSALTGVAANPAYSGTATVIHYSKYGANSIKSFVPPYVYLIGVGSGTGRGIYVDTDTNNGFIDSNNVNWTINGFTNNYYAETGTGDTIRSTAESITAADDITGTGIVNFIAASGATSYGKQGITGGGAFTIDTANEWHFVHTLTGGATYKDVELETGASGAITAFADAGSGQVTVTSAGHGQAEDDYLTITGTTNYNGVFQITNVTTDTFEITDTWVADDGTGTWRHGSGIIIKHRGAYLVAFAFSVSAAGANKEFDFAVFNGDSLVDGANITRSFGTANAVGSVTGMSIDFFERDDHVYFGIKNNTDATNSAFSEGNFIVTKIN